MADLRQKIHDRLAHAFSAESVRVEDESHKHQGHAEAKKHGGGHFAVFIVAEKFNELSVLERHRVIYDALKDFLDGDIHALSIQAFSPTEWAERSAS